MKRRSPEQAGYEPLGTLPALGRATRFRIAGGELLRLPGEDPARAPLRWGMARGIGALEGAGQDEQGVWFARKQTGLPLSRWLKSAPALGSGLALFVALARLLELCEGQKVFPGALLPEQVLVDEVTLEPTLLAEGWLCRALGAESHEPSPERHTLRFFPPEQARGADWDAAANRYVFGLLLYELLAGEPAFAGQGLRLSLDERSQRAPAALTPERSALLAPGLQSLCLRLLDPERTKRPESAAELGKELSRLCVPGQRSAAAPERQIEDKPRPVSAPRTDRARPRVRLSLSLTALLTGLVLVALALGTRYQAHAEPPKAGTRAALAAASNAADCASCHPRQSAEWRGSVMAHAATSPLFQALEQLIEEQVGRDADCPAGAGVLRPTGAGACRDRQTGLSVTGSGGEGWCSNCHLPGVQLTHAPAAFDALSVRADSRSPLAELVAPSAEQGIACAVCHQAAGPVPKASDARGEYVGNPSWTSASSGRRFEFRPEEFVGKLGISNSGYRLDPRIFLASAGATGGELVPGGAHRRTPDSALRYQRSSEFCGSCHDVRLFGTDALARRGEHFKRLRNAYSEWSDWAETRKRRGLSAPSCIDCHMSTYPGVCLSDTPGGAARDARCPPGTHFEAAAAGSLSEGRVATNSERAGPLHAHYFTGVETPLDPRLALAPADESLLDAAGIPLGPRTRRDLLLESSLRLEIAPLERRGAELSVPVEVENVGAGHRVPAGFSQEREIWVHLTVRDADGRLVYEVGKVSRADEDLPDKRFLRVNTGDDNLDARGRPLGSFGADVTDGPDVPRWSPGPELGGGRFRGQGLINFQNGFLRCVKCIGRIDSNGRCQALPGQERTRAARFDDGIYDPETGSCSSNLLGR
ncbi:MAG TPA: hypothetical protein VGP93_03295, partial [Polyangiaceae bacterium]|nr:hypothetical protein [Polyangiaceae bacterium]